MTDECLTVYKQLGSLMQGDISIAVIMHWDFLVVKISVPFQVLRVLTGIFCDDSRFK